MLRVFLIIFLFVVAAPVPLLAETLKGRVVGVSDGDTLTLLTEDKKQVKVRLSGIDAPENGQPFGEKAKQELSGLVFSKPVSLSVEGRDRYGRTLGIIKTEDGANVNALLVMRGYAWWYRKYLPYSRLLEKFESDAKAEKLGLWRDANPVPPWEWRRNGGPDVQALSKKGIIIGNRNSKIYHLPGCSTYSKVSEKNRVLFKSEEEAEKEGYSMARNCG